MGKSQHERADKLRFTMAPVMSESEESRDSMETRQPRAEAQAEPSEVVVNDEELVKEGQFNLIKTTLNDHNIKLWTEPFVKKGTNEELLGEEHELIDLASTIGTLLSLNEVTTLEGIKYLQTSALEKLAAREALNKSGQIMVRLKLPKSVTDKDPNVANTLEVGKGSDGRHLAEAIATVIQCSSEGLKMISNGKVIQSDVNLLEQGLKPGCVIMVLSISKDNQALKVLDEQRKILDDTKKDAKLLGCTDDGGIRLSIADHKGRAVNLPDKERKALIIALSLHEKGRHALKRKDFDLGLVLLLEAKSEYAHCRSELLKNVDNYALLNLDIAWCYLKLGNLAQLPNAKDRLDECEGLLDKSYGKNLERVMKMKGHRESERAIVMRLHLLQGIVSFHRGRNREAQVLLFLAKMELEDLEVSEDAMAEIMALGYSEREGRLALRVTGEDSVAEAVAFAEIQREKKRKVVEEEQERRRKRRKFGKTHDGRYVNIGYVQTMVGMGICEDYAVAALKQTNNSMESAIEAVQDTPDIIAVLASNFEEERNKPDTSEEAQFKRDVKQAKSEAIKRMRDDIASLGDTDDHLDLDLKEESVLLRKYMGLLGIE